MKDDDVQFVREFNRFYTNIIGLVDQHLLDSPFTLPEGRVLYELYHLQPCTAREIMARIRIDKGYLSRVLAAFTKKKLLTREKNSDDGRAANLRLTPKGEAAFQSINQSSVDQIKSITRGLSAAEKSKLIAHMKGIKEILDHHDIK